MNARYAVVSRAHIRLFTGDRRTDASDGFDLAAVAERAVSPRLR